LNHLLIEGCFRQCHSPVLLLALGGECISRHATTSAARWRPNARSRTASIPSRDSDGADGRFFHKPRPKTKWYWAWLGA
jgi:hypothetical protein